MPFTLDDFALDGKVAVVTGGVGGIGQAIVQALGVCRATVITLDLDTTTADVGVRDASALLVDVDVTDDDAMRGVAASIAERFGGVQVLVNCAGIGGRAPALTLDPALLDRVLDVNLKGTLFACQAFGASMVAAGAGSIVNISSIGGIVGFPGSVAYQASKGAVSQLTRSLAVEWAPSRVRVNAIAPGHTRTPLVERQWAREPELRAYFLDRTPLGRLADPQDIAGAVVFLASDASSMVTGQVLAVDGGFTAQ